LPLNEQTAARFAQLALDCVHREYPNKIAHTLASDVDVLAPRVLTPAFYGCFDWHSAVHGHWMLARLARMFPRASFSAAARAALARNITPKNIAAEVRYLEAPGRTAFERPYGLAWLLTLTAELRQSNSDLARVLEPLESAASKKLEEWLPKLPFPDRSGQHANTAFALGLAIDSTGAPWLRAHAERFYGRDRNAPIAFEPSGEDFLSPCLAEADVMRRVYPPQQFADWLSGFLPDFEGLKPVASPDPSDGKLAHLDGLNLSRAWMLRGIAEGLPEGDARRPRFMATADAHRRAGLAAVTGTHYEGGHWLGTFAVYLETGG
jgi:Protein of unknown function (DUF2891)